MAWEASAGCCVGLRRFADGAVCCWCGLLLVRFAAGAAESV